MHFFSTALFNRPRFLPFVGPFVGLVTLLSVPKIVRIMSIYRTLDLFAPVLLDQSRFVPINQHLLQERINSYPDILIIWLLPKYQMRCFNVATTITSSPQLSHLFLLYFKCFSSFTFSTFCCKYQVRCVNRGPLHPKNGRIRKRQRSIQHRRTLQPNRL